LKAFLRNFGGLSLFSIKEILPKHYNNFNEIKLSQEELIYQNLEEFGINTRHLMLITSNIEHGVSLVREKLLE
jgi:hypothetical protein